MTRHAWVKDLGVRQRLARVERLLEYTVAGEAAPPLFHSQVLNRRSKRLRAALLLLASRFGPTDPGPILDQVAAGLELLHEGTLYHDDIVDEADLRRGEPTAQNAFGTAVSAFAGSELLYATGQFFADIPSHLRRAVAHATDALCRGQLGELEAMGDLTLELRARLRIMRGKTAGLFSLAARLGADLGGADTLTLRHLTRFGMHFGMCFQLADDLRDLLATADDLGRPPGSDLYDGVPTLPIIFALGSDDSGGSLRAHLREVQRARDPRSVEQCLSSIEATGGVRRARATLDGWLSAARMELIKLPRIRGDAPLQSLDVLLEHLRTAVPTERARSTNSDTESTRAHSAFQTR